MHKEDKDRLNVLIKRISNGEKEAFNDVYSLMYNVLYCFLKKYWNDKEVIKDAIIATFETIFEKSKTKLFFNNCYNWILTIAHNHLRNIIRKECRTIHIEEIDINQSYDLDLNSLSLKLILDSLSKIDQELVYLKYHSGLKLKEISKLTKISESTLKRRYNLIYKYIKENLEKDGRA